MLQNDQKRREVQAELNVDSENALRRVEVLAMAFHRAAVSLRNRKHGRPPFFIENEYDVQDLLEVLLQSSFKGRSS